MDNLIKFRDLLVSVDDFSWDDSLFLTEDKSWSLDSSCTVLNMDDLEDDEEVPKFATDNNLIYVLGIQEIQDIVANAQEQRPDCSEINLFEAFLFYYKNDAFITFTV